MKRRHRPESDLPCAQEGCWEMAVCAGYCAACYSAWRRLIHFTKSEWSLILQRRRRLLARVEVRARLHIRPNEDATVGSVFGRGRYAVGAAARRSGRRAA